MLKSLEQLRYGSYSPRSFQAAAAMNRVFDLELSRASKIMRFHRTSVCTLDLEKIDERFLLSGGNNGAICIHDLLNRSGGYFYTAEVVCAVRSQSEYAHKFSIVTAQWYPFDTGVFISTGMDNKLKIWDTNCLRPVDIISFDYKPYWHDVSSVSTQHSLISVGLGFPHVLLIDPRTGSQCHELRGHKNAVTHVKWSPTSEFLLASGGLDNKIFLWDIRSARGYLQTLDQHNGEAIGSSKDLKTAHDGEVVSMRFTEDGLYLLSYGSDMRLRLWDVALCKNTLVNYGSVRNNYTVFTRSMDLTYESNPPLLFKPCGKFINVYDLFSGCKIKTLIGHFDRVSSCMFRSSTHELLSAGFDENIFLWTPDREREKEEAPFTLKKLQLSIHLEALPNLDLDSDSWSSNAEEEEEEEEEEQQQS